jgi:hypothetical protein
MQAIYHIGLKVLCNGYVTDRLFCETIALIISVVLCNGYVIGKWFLFDEIHVLCCKSMLFHDNVPFEFTDNLTSSHD